jgi:hypothetical protein
MNKERYNQIVDEVFKKYADSHWTLPENPNGPLLSDQLWSLKPMQHSKETFINECKTDKEFSNRFGLKIEERELSLEERTEILKDQSDNKEYFYDNNGNLIIESEWVLNKSNIPTKLITVTYKDEIIESYDND